MKTQKQINLILTNKDYSPILVIEEKINITSYIEEICKRLTYKYIHINGKSIDNKNSLFKEIAIALEFPDYFGKNWDALTDCLRDLEWIPSSGYVVTFDNIGKLVKLAREEFQTFLEIVGFVASSYWFSKGIPFYVILIANKKQKKEIKHNILLEKLVRVLD